MLIVIPAILLLGFLLWALFRTPEKHDDSRYAKTRNFMDFDPGVDEDKVGDPEYPNAGVDSVMKHEFMNDLLDEDKN